MGQTVSDQGQPVLITGGGVLNLLIPSLMKSAPVLKVPVAKGILGSALFGICKP